MTTLVHRLDVLRINWFGNAINEAKPLGQLNPRQPLEALKDQVLFDGAFDNQPVAMIAVTRRQNPVWLNRVPESYVFQWFQPFLNILNIFKNNHPKIVSDHCFETQISNAKELSHEL
ncbi:hypothetical protein [Ruegeria sp. HKCCD8929]|uniref:hypothetical protein n=1 Tax=Ruegeria sp. HKCCD8929 TaxID=2683006 RepID=UPI001489FEEC|nr:hypothetical protein [Ruegeria sp. HKCCD8929]